ncbi:DNA polymerase IV [Lysinibacillus piscis]|uniref:DNA polymerase IV n=1 Tax=Lysinibacillus piscis TaxID=2518931 RepID=A0ABQ5NLV1_9BACI|nr:DNA polymerase IV [Lysinibacillus sp. KH24]GLC89282.1 DNA polymerase IV 1 [Lysinibacillus sp. KH24]
MAHMGRIIFHIDMNSFYASVEQAHDPSLKGKPLAIAGNPKERRGILVTCSYEARAHGIYTTMTVHEALRKCPELLLLPPDFPKYREASKKMFTILRSYTDLVEPVSIDEGYMDVTLLCQEQHALTIAKEIQSRILQELDLPCSIGIAPNKFLAKTASDMKKPMGITVLRIRDVAHMLWPREVITMHGIGASTAKKLNAQGILTIGDLAQADDYKLKQLLGKNGERLRARANGMDERVVDPNAIFDTKSVGNSTTLPEDIADIRQLQKVMKGLCKKVAERLEAKRLAGFTVSIQIRDANWQNHSRSKTVSNAMYQAEDILAIAFALLERHWDETPVRLLGVTVSNVTDRKEYSQQLSIFNFEEHSKDEPILKVVDEIEERFGKGAITRGVDIGKRPSYQSQTSFSKDFLDDHDV